MSNLTCTQHNLCILESSSLFEFRKKTTCHWNLHKQFYIINGHTNNIDSK